MIYSSSYSHVWALLGLLLLSPSVLGKKKPPTKKPNILMIMTDDQDLLLNSMDVMTNVNKLIADKGTTLDKHYCTAAFCCPSRVSLYSGKCVHNTNVTDVVSPYGGYPKFITQGLNDDYLPVWLQQGGVNTYYVGKFANSHNIQNYQKSPIKGWTSSNFLLEPGTYDYTNTTWTKDLKKWQSFPHQNAIDVTERHAMDMLKQAAGAKKPFFMTIAPAVPHVGINATTGETFFPIPQKKWENAFKDKVVPRDPSYNPDKMNMGASWVLNLPKLNQTFVDGMDDLYRARLQALAGVDDMVGKLVSMLDKYKLLENTHIIFTTDNGYHIGQHRFGPGKKQGYETDINIPLVWRGPGVKAGETSHAVSTHTDLAPTFLNLFGLPQRTTLDGRTIPEIVHSRAPSGEHINVEMWGSADIYEVLPFKELDETIPGYQNNTYKSLRIVSENYSLYYSVWCTNEHELYDMVRDKYQTNNLLPNTTSIDHIPTEMIPAGSSIFSQTLSLPHPISKPDKREDDKWPHTGHGEVKNKGPMLMGRPLKSVVQRLDALMMVLKTCVGVECTKPWAQLHPQGNITTLEQALDHKFDRFYAAQPRVTFKACKQGYLPEYEGAQHALVYG